MSALGNREVVTLLPYVQPPCSNSILWLAEIQPCPASNNTGGLGETISLFDWGIAWAVNYSDLEFSGYFRSLVAPAFSGSSCGGPDSFLGKGLYVVRFIVVPGCVTLRLEYWQRTLCKATQSVWKFKVGQHQCLPWLSGLFPDGSLNSSFWFWICLCKAATTIIIALK